MEKIKLKSLAPNPKNPRKITDKKKEMLKKALIQFGDLSGIVFNRRSQMLVGGHQRREVMPDDAEITIEKKYKDLTRTGTVCEGYVLIDGERYKYREVDWDEPTEKAANIAANKHGGDWELKQLAEWVLELDHLNIDMDLIGFTDDELKRLMAPVTQVEATDADNSIPSLPKEAKTKKGDVWYLGDHKLMCGDSNSITDIQKLMEGQFATMVFTSPPYNGDTHLDYGGGVNKKLYENKLDNKDSKEYVDFCQGVIGNLLSVTRGFIFWNVSYNAKSRFEFLQALQPFLPSLWETIVWKKTGMPVPHGLTRNCEFIFCLKQNSKKEHLGVENKTEFNLWEISNIGAQDKENHRAAFPVELPMKGIELASEAGDIVLEPFCGSGSTIIACEKLRRNCFAMELDPLYCDLIINRFKKLTGKRVYRRDENGSVYDW